MHNWLYQSQTLAIRIVPAADSDTWFVTFDNHNSEAALDRAGFGESYLKNEGISAIHVVGCGNDWYQYADMPIALAAIRSRIKDARRIVTYGSSMGGYAAIRFAGAIGAHAALALSPQYSNDPREVPWERRWIDDAHRIWWRPALGGFDHSARAYVVFDPTNDDRLHAEMIAARTRSTLIPTHHAGHPVSTFLSEIGLLRMLVEATRADQLDAIEFIRLTRQRRAASSVYLSHLALAQPARRAKIAVQLAERALSIDPNGAIALQTYGIVLSRAGRHDDAIATLTAIADGSGEQVATHLYWLAEALKAADRHGEAIERMAQMIALQPGQAHLRMWRAAALARSGNRHEAIREQAYAVRLAPANHSYHRRLWRYRLMRVLPFLRLR